MTKARRRDKASNPTWRAARVSSLSCARHLIPRSAGATGCALAAFLSVTIALSLFDPALALDQTSSCGNLTPQEGTLGYQWRGDRCEGLYVQDIRSSVRLKALMTSRSSEAMTTRELRVALPPGAPAGDYLLRVDTLDPHIHYRLDAAVPKAGAFVWSAREIIDQAGLNRSSLTLLSWSAGQSPIYVPISIAPSSGTGTDIAGRSVIRAIIESTVPIERYVARLKVDGSETSEQLSGGTELPATLLKLDLPRQASGQYRLWLRVRLLGEARPETLSWLIWLP